MMQRRVRVDYPARWMCCAATRGRAGLAAQGAIAMGEAYIVSSAEVNLDASYPSSTYSVLPLP